MNWPMVTVLVCTFERDEVLARVVETLRQRLHYPNLNWVICDDASPHAYATSIAMRYPDVSVVRTPANGGWGVNVNNGLAHINTDYVFFTEDDKLIYRDLDLREGVALLEELPEVGMVRYKGTAGTDCVFNQLEVDIRRELPDYMDGPGGVQGKLTYLRLSQSSPTLYVYTNGPHLKHKRFHEFYGIYNEHLTLGLTEEAFCHRVHDSMMMEYAPQIVILPDWVKPYFVDIGQSYQGTEFDHV